MSSRRPVNFLNVVILTLTALYSAASYSEDIDLFVGNSPSVDPATVMLAWHTSANISANAVHGCTYINGSGNPTIEFPSLGAATVGGMEQCAIVNALQTVKNSPELLGTLRVGLMTFNDSQTGVGGGNCGFLMVPPRILDESGIDSFISTMKGLSSVPGNQSKLGEMVAEVWAALNGLSTSCSGVDYSSLATTSANCSKSVMIYIGNAVKSNASVKDGNDNAGTVLKSQLNNAFGYGTGSAKYNQFATIRTSTSFNLSPADAYWGDEWMRFMRYVDVDDSAQLDRNVTTYTIAVYGSDFASQTVDEVAFYQEMARVGGGESYLVESTESSALTDVLLEIFNEVQDVNSVFSSATLPVSANTQGTFENQIYIAMFRPDPSGGPRWMGNVKQFQFGVDSGGAIVLTDADDTTTNSNSIVNNETGGLVDDAVSFWTTNTPSGQSDWPLFPDGFWRNSPEGDGGVLDSPDGDLVQKGGAGQMLRIEYLTSTANRRVYTNKCPSSGCASTGLANFDSNNDLLSTYYASQLSVSASSDTAAITAGAYGTTDGTVSCSKNRGKYDCVYTLTNFSILGDAANFNFNSANDAVILGSGIPGSSTCGSSPCAFTAGTADGFTLRLGKVDLSGSFSNTTIIKASKLLNIQQAGYSINGTSTTLEGCGISGSTGVSDIYNGSFLIPNITVANSTPVDSSNFTGTISDWVMVRTTANIQCGSSASTLTGNNLINWVRGDDIAGNEAMTGPCPLGARGTSCPISIRGSVHGDVLHSRPAVVNYGTARGGVVVFYGSNDGHFRAINGNRSASITSGGVTVRPGGELWSFVAEDFLDQFPRLFNDDPAIRFPNTAAGSPAQRRQYFMDGSTTFFQDNRSTGATSGDVYLYMTARRGGRFIYAFDVTTPLAPSLMWKLDTSIINELGYTWSQPKVTKIGGRDRPVLIFGAGNSLTQNDDPVVASDTMGRGIVIADGITGKIIWAALKSCAGVTSRLSTVATEGVTGSCVVDANLVSAFAADITIVDRRGDGYTDRLYASDVGGNIWRVDLDKTDYFTTSAGLSVPSSDIQLSKFATLSTTGNGSRKFLYGVDVIPTYSRDLVVAVSGDREHPLFNADTTASTAHNVQNRFYLLIDPNTGPSAGTTAAIVNTELLDQSSIGNNCFDAATAGFDATSAQNAATACSGTNTERYIFDGRNTNYKGYFFDFAAGEKGVNAPLTEAGTVYFGTNQPDTRTNTTSCKSGLGRAFAYQVDLFSGERKLIEYSGGGLPPSSISGLVNINGSIRFFLMGGDGDSIFKPKDGKEISSGRKRMYYFYK
ncbi:MAG: type IV pilus assembly protein PilY1 [Zhongshania sp.]|jgi:type IV pilus assembly protein PilY1